MIVCDRCRRAARAFAYGDFINESYDIADLCFECTKELKDLIWNFRTNGSKTFENEEPKK